MNNSDIIDMINEIIDETKTLQTDTISKKQFAKGSYGIWALEELTEWLSEDYCESDIVIYDFTRAMLDCLALAPDSKKAIFESAIDILGRLNRRIRKESTSLTVYKALKRKEQL
ncbi:MAG: hypothetical protein LBM93_02520 [Oscillospiraceae bacterium]|jgi:hypothetical protein|nr:hypothetical protein [Oscillospiraceae bacterium]